MNPENAIVEMRELTRWFGKTCALNNINLDIRRGRIIGLLGANAAGKSTLLHHITGLYLPTGGTCTTLGCPAGDLGPAQMARIGYVHQEVQLLNWMKVRQLIRYVSAYYDGWNHDLEQRLVAEFELPEKKRVGVLSPGQQQRLSILLAVSHEPELLILDEPAASLDPIARAHFLDLLMEIIQDVSRTIIISSHILSDVEKVIDHVLIMDDGGLVCDKRLDALQEEYCRLRISAIEGELPENLPLEGIVDFQGDGAERLVTVKMPAGDARAIVEASGGCRVEAESLSLEDLYRVILSEAHEEVGV